MQELAPLKKRKVKSKKPTRAKRRKRIAQTTAAQKQKWLILAGTKDARDFITYWRDHQDVELVASLAGVTSHAVDLGVETRSGGFSYHNEAGVLIDGITALTDFLKSGQFTALIDITHPFAAQISAHARQACTARDIPYFQFLRAPWQALAGDDWVFHDSWEALFASVKTRHLFIAGGHEALQALHADSQAQMTARVIEPPRIALSDLPAKLDVILGPPTVSAGQEEALFRQRKITAIAAKLSGGKASAGKLAAARALGLPVHLVKRPDYPEGWFDALPKLHQKLVRTLLHPKEPLS